MKSSRVPRSTLRSVRSVVRGLLVFLILAGGTSAWSAPAAQSGDDGPKVRRVLTPEQVLEAERSTATRLEQWRARGIDPASPSPILTSQPPEFWQALTAATNSDHLFTDLAYLSTQLQTRYYSTPQLNLACQFVYDEFVSMGYTTSFDNYTYNGYSLKNVLAVKTGTVDPTRIYVVVGHLDSTSPSPTTTAPGADDNGSGSVAVLECARLLAGLQTDYTIYFLLVTAEEQGLIGSEHFAAMADQQNLDIRGVLDLDMVSWYDPSGADLWIEGFHYGVSSVWLMQQLGLNASTYSGLSLYYYPGEGWGSDHEPFHAHGYPAILSIENEYDYYPCYHRACDTVDNLNGPFWAKITAANAVTAGQLAQVQGSVGAITGTVTLAGGGDPSGITIRLKGTRIQNQVTDGAGNFTFSSIFPTGFSVVVEKTGYVGQTIPVTVASGQTVHIDVNLEPILPGVVAGFVRAADGSPVSGAKIEVEGQAGSAYSGADGAYLLSPLWPGTLQLCATYPGQTPRGTRVVLSSGQNMTGVDFTLEPAWDFEDNDEGLSANTGWQWGHDALPGAHSGQKLWGTVLEANYANCAGYTLSLPPVSLLSYQSANLRVWSWLAAQSNHDGGNLKVSTDGGTNWTLVTPTGGYGGTLSGSCNPFTGQSAFTGSSGGWVEKVFPLDAYVGRWIRLKFDFGSDNATRDRGWYIDDLSLEGTLLGVDAPEPVASGPSSRHAELEAMPNPSPAGTTLVLRLGQDQRGSLSIISADGRRVAKIAAAANWSAGVHEFRWNGRTEDGREAASGIYWATWDGGKELVRRAVVLLR